VWGAPAGRRGPAGTTLRGETGVDDGVSAKRRQEMTSEVVPCRRFVVPTAAGGIERPHAATDLPGAPRPFVASFSRTPAFGPNWNLF